MIVNHSDYSVWEHCYFNPGMRIRVETSRIIFGTPKKKHPDQNSRIYIYISNYNSMVTLSMYTERQIANYILRCFGSWCLLIIVLRNTEIPLIVFYNI